MPNRIIVNAYIGGHAFEVDCDYTPEQIGDLETEYLEEELDIKNIFLGQTDVTQLLLEEACDLNDRIYAQALTRIKEGDL